MSYRSELIQVAAVALAAIQVEEGGSTEITSSAGRSKMRTLLSEVSWEREHQERKWGARTCTGPFARSWWLTVLTEELGEAARAVLEDSVKCPPTKK